MEGGFFSDGLRRAKAGLQRLTPTKASQQDSDVSPALLARAVTAGAVAGAYAGAVAGATAAAATVHEGLQRKGPNSPAAAQTPAAQSSAWQRTWDASTGAWYYWHTVTRETTWTPPPEFATPSTPATAGDVALDLARTVTLNEYVDKSGFSERTGGASTPSHRPADEPSLYAQDTDIDGSEEVDPRVGQALDDMNNSMVTVNELEAALTQAKRRAKQLEAEQRIICQDAYDKLSRGVKEILPAYTRQLLAVQQQQQTQRAFVEYQRAHDAHMAAKAAVAELENRLMATSGGAQVDVQLLSQCSDLASRVVQTESAKLRADRVHAVEARRLSSLLLELKQGPRITKEHSERAQPYIEVKQRAEALLKQCVERISQVETELADAKQAYRSAMERLDTISREIHDRRQASRAAEQEQDTATGAAAAEDARAQEEPPAEDVHANNRSTAETVLPDSTAD